MKPVQRMTAAELDIMQILWELDAPIRPSALLDLITPVHPWSISTLQTLLDRLRVKGVTAFQCEKRFRYYYPAVTREEYAVIEAQFLVDEICKGKAAPLVSSLLSRNAFEKGELEEIAVLAEIAKKEKIKEELKDAN